MELIRSYNYINKWKIERKSSHFWKKKNNYMLWLDVILVLNVVSFRKKTNQTMLRFNSLNIYDLPIDLNWQEQKNSLPKKFLSYRIKLNDWMKGKNLWKVHYDSIWIQT